MPIVHKQVRLLGREPIPRFAREATLCWFGYESIAQPTDFPEQWSIYNIAALALYPREGAIGSAVTPSRSLTYWAPSSVVGIENVFGTSTIKIPHSCEWFSLAWLTPPQVWLDEAGPFPEEMFRIRWDLAI